MKSLRHSAKANNEQHFEFRDGSGRFLSPDELTTLITASWDGPLRFGMTGPERSMLYRLASETGLRFAQLRRLTPSSFQLGKSPTVAVAVGDRIRGRYVMLPLRPETAEALGSFLIVPEANQPVFRFPDNPAEMLHDDLLAAKAAAIEATEKKAKRAGTRELQTDDHD